MTPDTGASARLEEIDMDAVYFVHRDGFVKIGYSGDWPERVKAISKGSCMPDGMTVGPVDVLAIVEGDRELEGDLHDKFKNDRLPRTEWFYPSLSLIDYIESLMNGYCNECRRAVVAQPCENCPLEVFLSDGSHGWLNPSVEVYGNFECLDLKNLSQVDIVAREPLCSDWFCPFCLESDPYYEPEVIMFRNYEGLREAVAVNVGLVPILRPVLSVAA